jgi:dihydroorotate dehydrogenase electron transfer subunit
VRLLIGTDSEQAAVIRTANEMHRSDPSTPLLVLIGSAGAFSFKPRPSTILVPGMLPGVIAAVPSLEEFGIASRLASEIGLPGCYDGTVNELAERWLEALDPVMRAQTQVTIISRS